MPFFVERFVRHDAEVNIFLYYVEYEVELGVCECVCVCVCVPGFKREWACQWKKNLKKKKEEREREKQKISFLLICQITGWKALADSKSGFEFMPQRDQTGRFFSTNKF